MKRFYFTAFLLVFFLAQRADAQNLPQNSIGKIEFRGEVVLPGAHLDDHFSEIVESVSHLKEIGKIKSKCKADSISGLVDTDASYLVYKQGMFTKQIHGDIRYHLQIKVSEEGFTYCFSNFSFVPYQRSRYGKYVPSKGMRKPLEEPTFVGMQETWDHHRFGLPLVVSSQIMELQSEIQKLATSARLK